jgi:acyl-CoA synthetase (AMP-forming)/AMP-acid ligase II
MTELHTQPGLPAMVRTWANLRPGAAAVIFLGDGENERARLSFGELNSTASRIASRLRDGESAEKPLLLLARSDLDFVRAFCGCLYAGSIIVPIPVPSSQARLERTRAIADRAGAVGVIGAAGARTKDALRGIPWIDLDGLDDATPVPMAGPPPDRIALLQFTSGSTAEPKGIAITHLNLGTNIEMVRKAFAVQDGSGLLGWLPLFHDMGLMGLMLSLYCGMPFILMPPMMFLQKPQRWLQAIARYGVTISGGPNFAFDACLEHADDAIVGGLDLSRWNTAFCGAEPVRRSTMHNFAERFASSGFKRSALYPCYGLAEATVYVAGGHLAESPSNESGTNQEKSSAVSCGCWPSGTVLRIVDPATHQRCDDESVGEIWVSGPHVGAGYWNDPAATSATFGARLAGEDDTPFLRTGDLGLVRGGELFVTGRLKDLIIVRGANIHPADIEASIGASHPAFASGGAAFSVELTSEEQIVAVHEIVRPAPSALDPAAMIDCAVQAIAESLGLRLYDLVLVKHGHIPRTTSGKIRRQQCRTLYREAALIRVGGLPAHPSLGRNHVRFSAEGETGLQRQQSSDHLEGVSTGDGFPQR